MHDDAIPQCSVISLWRHHHCDARVVNSQPHIRDNTYCLNVVYRLSYVFICCVATDKATETSLIWASSSLSCASTGIKIDAVSLIEVSLYFFVTAPSFHDILKTIWHLSRLFNPQGFLSNLIVLIKPHTFFKWPCGLILPWLWQWFINLSCIFTNT